MQTAATADLPWPKKISATFLALIFLVYQAVFAITTGVLSDIYDSARAKWPMSQHPSRLLAAVGENAAEMHIRHLGYFDPIPRCH